MPPRRTERYILVDFEFFDKMDLSKPYIESLFERDILSKTDIDAMEYAIRSIKSTALSNCPLKRCTILETSAYMSMRIKLLRWISDYAHGDGTNEGVAECVRFHIGDGISVRGEYGGSSSIPPRVSLSRRHNDNDGTLPILDPVLDTSHHTSNQPVKRQPMDAMEEDEPMKKPKAPKRKKNLDKAC